VAEPCVHADLISPEAFFLFSPIEKRFPLNYHSPWLNGLDLLVQKKFGIRLGDIAMYKKP